MATSVNTPATSAAKAGVKRPRRLHHAAWVTRERLHEEFPRRVKTQGSMPTEDAALVLLFSLMASGQIKLHRIDGWQKISTVLSEHTKAAA